jgi:hypothetical protein
LPATFRLLEFFRFFLIFSAQTRLFLTKSRKNNMGVFSTQFVPLISILATKIFLATKILEEQNCQL